MSTMSRTASQIPSNASSDRPVYAVYRMCSLGVALTDTLQQLVDTDQLNDTEAMQVLFQFDKSINKLLPRHVDAECRITGQLNSYRYRDQVWQLFTKNIKLQYIDTQLAYQIGNATPQQAIKSIEQQLNKYQYRNNQLKQLMSLSTDTDESVCPRDQADIEEELRVIKVEMDIYTTLKQYVITELQQNSAATQLSSKLKQAIYNVSDKTLCLNADVQLNESNQPIIDARGRKLIKSLKIAACELPRAKIG